MTDTQALPPQLERLKTAGAVAGALGLAALAVGFATDPGQFFRSYLFGYLFWVCVALGSLALTLIGHQTGGRWALVTRRLSEAAARTLPALALLFVPIALGLGRIYPWARPEAAQDHLIHEKAAYLNGPFFVGRAVFYFAVWALLAHLSSKWSRQLDGGPDPAVSRRLRILSGGGLVAMALTLTFMSVDWAMSLDPHWFSTVYGVWFMIGSLLAGLTFVVVVLGLACAERPFAGLVGRDDFHDLGKLTFAFLMFWAYIGFTQFLIIWSANLPEEIPWYLRRFQGGWEWLILAVVVFHFALPYALLLSQDVKRHVGRLRAVAAWILVMRAVDLFWLVGPDSAGHGGHGLHVHWMDVAAWVGLGGLFVLLYTLQLKGRPLLPVGEPVVREALRQAEGGAAALAGGHA